MHLDKILKHLNRQANSAHSETDRLDIDTNGLDRQTNRVDILILKHPNR